MTTGWYVPTAAPAPLAQVLACSWTATPTGEHRLVPDGCIDLLWTSGGEVWLCGPETTAWTFALPANTTAVGVRFLPGWAPQVLGFSANEVLNQRKLLSHFTDIDVQARLSAEIAEQPTTAARVHVLEQFVADRVGSAPATDGFADLVIKQLAAHPHDGTAMLANRIGLTPRQLHRRSLRSFGYGTSMLARLLRFQRLLALIDALGSAPAVLSRLAIEAGYSDQAHLTRDCRAITGQTPTRFLAEYFPTFPDMSDPYKTAELFAISVGP